MRKCPIYASSTLRKTLSEYDAFADTQLDEKIRHIVIILRNGGIETFESCEGGDGHPFAKPTVRFHGNQSEGFRALAYAQECGFKVTSLKRYWNVIDNEPHGPYWEMTFFLSDK